MELQPILIIHVTEETVGTTEFEFPMRMIIVTTVSSLENAISNNNQRADSKLRRYFILLLESIGEDADDLYTRMEENPQVISIFLVWNDDCIPTLKRTKLYYIPKEPISLCVTLSLIQFLKNEADKQVKLDQISLSKIYLRKAEKTKEWIMSNLRAEPCNILVIPLNTDSTNLIDTIQRLQQYCAKFGYSSAVVRSLDDYIPKSEIFDKLPYGKLIFEYEDPNIICRWLRLLSPIRVYLYGNEQIIPNEWSKLMIENEVDQKEKRLVDDDNWCTLLENDPVNDSVKWNFCSQHAQKWQIKDLRPIKLDTIDDNIRFRSALRRSTITFHQRMSTVTALVFEWFDDCLQQGYLKHEFQLTRQDKPVVVENLKIEEEFGILPFRFNNIGEFDLAMDTSGKDTSTFSVAYSSNQSNELVNYYSNKSDRIYIWLDNNLYSIDQRFHSTIFPHQWKHFSGVYDCQTFILNQQLRYNPKIYLLSTDSLAEQLFRYEHVWKIHVAYLYSNQNEIFSKWITSFPMIRGIYKNIDSLYKQFHFDITTNTESLSYHQEQQENQDPLPMSIFDIDRDGFERHRALVEIILRLPRTLESRQEMIDELRQVSSDNEVFLKQIYDFEQNYHSNAAIQWYTRNSCLYRLINEALRNKDIISITKYRFFISDLYQKLEELHNQIIISNKWTEQPVLSYFRGQLMSSSEIDQFKQHIGSLLSINTFFSTSLSADIAISFAGGPTFESTTSKKPVIFCIEVNPSLEKTRPYAAIHFFSTYEEEDEVLFALGSVFRIQKVDVSSENDNIQVIYLKMVDENDVPKESKSFDLSEFLSEQIMIDPVYILVDLESLFQDNEQRQHIETILRDVDVQFYPDTNYLDEYTKSIEVIQSFVIFMRSQSHIPERYQQTKLISYAENDMHFNDLIYLLLYEMEKNKKLQEHMKDLYIKIATVYRAFDERNFYVQLLLSSASRKESEEQLRTKLPASSILMTFYLTESCINFLQSITEPDKIGNVKLILQSDDTNLDNIIDQFEEIDSIKQMYVCSKNADNIQHRRIIHGKFLTEKELYVRLYSDNLFYSFAKANQQIDIHKNKNKAKQYLQETEEYYQLLKEHQNQDRMSIVKS